MEISAVDTIHLEGRDVNPWAEYVQPGNLIEGKTYFRSASSAQDDLSSPVQWVHATLRRWPVFGIGQRAVKARCRAALSPGNAV